MENNESVSPELFWRFMTAFQHSAALKAAVELDVFTAIDNGKTTASEISQTVGASQRGIRILCDTLTVIGFLTKDGDRYGLTENSAAFLSRNSRQFIGSAVEFIMSPEQTMGFNALTDAVRQGGSAVPENASLDPNSPMWVTFAKAMMPLMFPASQAIAHAIGGDVGKALKVLDIAAGHGIFGISVAQQYPKAEIYAVDWPNVLEVATENAQRFGVAERHHKIPGSAFDADFGGDFDLVLLTNFLHHFDRQTNTDLLRKIYAALKPGGRAFTLEFVPNDDRISPPQEALFSLVMLAATPQGDAYTFAELKQMFDEAGFSHSEVRSLEPIPQHLVVSTK